MSGTDATRARGGTPSVEASSWWHNVWRPFWAVPAACAVSAVALGLALPLLDEGLQTELPYVFQGGPSGARNLLGTIATGMISMTGLVFSITMVVLQLASSQFTPRVLGSFLESRITQATLGVFTASFVFALTVTRSVRGDYGETGTFVPQVSVTAAFVLVLASVGCFLAFIHHITSSGSMQEGQLRGMRPQDVLIAVSFAPYAEETESIVRHAHERGACIIAITDSRLSPLARFATCSLLVQETSVFGFRALTNSMAVAQSLFLALAYRLELDYQPTRASAV